MTILMLTFLPALAMIIGHFLFPKRITLPEIACGILVSLVLSAGMYQLGRYAQMADTELWNGEITSKTKVLDEYRRPYSCNCRTTKIGNTTSTKCSTCYHTGTDMFWDAQSNIGDFRIKHVDCSSTSEAWCLARYSDPERWVSIQKGDPVSKQNTYENYVKAANFGLFNKGNLSELEQSKAPNLEYPIEVYDHYHVDRVLLDGVKLPESLSKWNAGLSEILKTLGPKKQANIVLVLTNAGNPSYAELLLTQWEGANKNDIVIVAGFTNGRVAGEAPNWVFVHSWAKFDIVNVTIRDALLDHPEWWTSADALFPQIADQVLSHFERKPMEEFEYLANEVEPSTGAIIFMFILSVLAAGGMLWLFHEQDIFGHEGSGHRFRSY